MCRVALIAALVFTANAAFAQEEAPVSELEKRLQHAICTFEESMTAGLQEPYIIINAAGVEIRRAGFPAREDQTVNVYIWGDPEVTQRLYLTRTSPDRNLNVLRVRGLDDAIAGFEGCRLRHRALHDFEPPTGRFVLEAYDTEAGELKQIGRPFSFSVQTVYRAAVSFGPMVSHLRGRSYSVVQVSDTTFALSEFSSERDLDYMLGFTYYLNHGRTSTSTPGLGVFFGIPVTSDFGNSAFAGFSVDFGTVFLAHLGARVGKVNQLAEAQQSLIGQPVAEGFQPVTESVWRFGLTFGVSIDAAQATRAFGRALTGLGGG